MAGRNKSILTRFSNTWRHFLQKNIDDVKQGFWQPDKALLETEKLVFDFSTKANVADWRLADDRNIGGVYHLVNVS